MEQAPSPRICGEVDETSTDKSETRLSVGSRCCTVAGGGVMDNSALERSAGKRGREPAGRLLGALCTLNSTLFAFIPGKLCGDVLSPNLTPSETTCNSAVPVRGFCLPTVGNVVVVGNGAGDVENDVAEFVAEHVVDSAQTELGGRQGSAGMHRRPSELQSTINEKNFKNG